MKFIIFKKFFFFQNYKVFFLKNLPSLLITLKNLLKLSLVLLWSELLAEIVPDRAGWDTFS